MMQQHGHKFRTTVYLVYLLICYRYRYNYGRQRHKQFWSDTLPVSVILLYNIWLKTWNKGFPWSPTIWHDSGWHLWKEAIPNSTPRLKCSIRRAAQTRAPACALSDETEPDQWARNDGKQKSPSHRLFIADIWGGGGRGATSCRPLNVISKSYQRYITPLFFDSRSSLWTIR